MTSLPTSPRKVLIVRLSAIGDIVMAAPVARALKARQPSLEIHWLAQPECLTLVSDDPAIDKTIAWPRKHWSELWAQKRYWTLAKVIGAFRQQLRAEHYDLAIDLQGLLKSGLLTWLSGASFKLGLGSREGSQYFMNTCVARDLGDQDLIGSEYRTLIETLAPDSNYHLALAVSAANTRNAQTKIHELGLDNGFIALCPFTTRPQKHWIDTYWRELALHLIATQALPLVVLGGPADRDYATRLFEGISVHNLAGQTNLQEAGAMIAASTALVGVDTGLTHMGHAANVPTVTIFGSTRPYLNAEKPASRIIYNSRSCSPCKRHPTCNGRYDCMRDIRPGQVAAELFDAIAAATA